MTAAARDAGARAVARGVAGVVGVMTAAVARDWSATRPPAKSPLPARLEW